MKKAVIIMIICFFAFPLCVYAGGCAEKDTAVDNSQTESENETGENEEGAGEETSDESENETGEESAKERKEPYRMKDRAFEIGINAGGGLMNNLVSTKDIFKEIVELDLDGFSDDLKMHLGLNATPFYFKYNGGNTGYGLSTNINATGIFNLSKELLALSPADDEKSSISGAVYADIGMDIFFSIANFKITLRPAAFYPLAVLKSEIAYTYDNISGTLIDLDFNTRLYTPVSMEDNAMGYIPKGMPGIDFSLSLEFPLGKATGLQNRFPFLDFDLGLSLINIPLTSASLKYYMERSGSINIGGGDTLEDMFGSFDNMDDTLGEAVYGEEKITVYRPFKMLAWINFRPINGTRWLTITPSFGYSMNHIYENPFSYEGGVKMCVDISNIFIVTAGMNYEDRMWVNSLDLALNFRAIELNVGADLRSPGFMKVFNANGLGARVGIKFGW